MELIELQVNDDVANGLPLCREEQQKLLQDARAKRDTFAQEKARVENLLSVTIEKVKVYKALLGSTESKLCSIEDLIGSIRFRLRQRGIPTHTIMVTSPPPAPSETGDDRGSAESGHSPGVCFPPTPCALH